MSTSRNIKKTVAIPSSRPFTTRSVIASTLLGSHPPLLPVRVLVRSAVMFGISEGTVRVALTRMVTTGELQTNGDGLYELIGHLRKRQTRQDQSRIGVASHDWDGDWEMGVVHSTEARSAASRAELRNALKRLRFGELREGVWLRPNNLDPKRLTEDREFADESVRWFVAQPSDAIDTAHRLWDLDEWNTTANQMIDQLRSETKTLTRVTADQELASAFTLSATVLRHFQADPLLPAQLLPKHWVGLKLRDQFETFDIVFQQCWRTWLRP
jgi:phenylacetic acid degradation operon negative regulatory protein